jgi:hypothetical protein
VIAAIALAAVLAQAPGAPASPGAEPPAGKPPYPVQARVQRTEVKLGEPFGYEIEVRHPASLTLALPEALPQDGVPSQSKDGVLSLSKEPFVLEPGRCRREPAEDDVVSTCAMTAALIALGPHDLPALALALTGPGGTTTLQVPGPRVTGAGVLDPAAPTDRLVLRDLAPPAPLMVRSLRLVWWTLGVLAALAAALLAWRAWRRRRTRAVEPPPPVPPHERLARRLAALEADRLGERGHARAHFYRLSELVREYLGALLGVPALDLTTEELLERARASGDPRLDPDALRPFLEGVDLVKFARAEAGPVECAAGIAWTRGLLERTRPVEPGSPGAPPQGEKA